MGEENQVRIDLKVCCREKGKRGRKKVGEDTFIEREQEREKYRSNRIGERRKKGGE